MTCKICGLETSKFGIVRHITGVHKITKEEYYNQYLRRPDETGLCLFCNQPTPLKSIIEGYTKYCSNKCHNKHQEILGPLEHEENTKKHEDERQTELDETNSIVCKICNLKVHKKSLTHFQIKHGLSPKEYYDQYLKTDDKEGLCLHCGKETNFQSILTGYCKFCCTECLNKSDYHQEKKLEGYRRNLEVDNPSQSPEVQQKKVDTCQEKYGANHWKQSEQGNEEWKENFKEIYGVENPSQLKSTMIIKYRNKWETAIKLLSDEFEFPNSVTDMLNDKTKRITICKQCKKTMIFESLFVFGSYIKCLICNKKFGSYLEKEMDGFLNYTTVESEIHNRTILSYNKELDFYLPDHKLAIEMNGLFWHSEGSIIHNFKPDLKNDVLFAELNEKKPYHYNKYLECQKQGIHLIQIFEDEWNNKQEICKSRIKQALGLTGNKIYGRDCEIREIDYQTSTNFLNENHLQGKDNSSIRFGAFYNNELVATMTFARPNISKGGNPKQEGVFELSRFAIKSDWSITGVAERLLKQFELKVNPNILYSYCDLRWFQGNVYLRLGFTLEKWTGLNYWYTDGFERKHRFGFRKQPNEPKDIPEWILRAEQGLFRIWDCGNLKFIKKYR